MKSTVTMTAFAAALVGIGFASVPARAQVFAGGTVGQSNVGNYEFSDTDTNQHQDDTDTAYSVFIGYQFNKYLAAALGYTDLGELKASADAGGTQPYSDTIKAKTMDISAIGILPFSVFSGEGSFLSRFSIFAQVGLAIWDQDVNCTACDSGSDFKGGDTGTNLLLGGGINVAINRHLGIHVRYADYPDIGNHDAYDTGHQQDWDFWGIGGTWNFGD